MKKYDLIIIGGGASGLMAANAASQYKNKNILLIEKNEKLGKKLFITGKGRCNITNKVDISEFFDSITENSDFMYSSLYSFSNEALIQFFKNKGLNTKVERGDRVFPVSDKSSDVIKALSKFPNNVDINLNTEVKKLIRVDKSFQIVTDKGIYGCEKVIVATGGLSYPATGSTGDGYEVAKEFGHSVSRLRPSLCPFILEHDNLKELAGLTVKNAEITAIINKKDKISYFGDFLFTHKGISGPIVLTLSDYITDYDPKDVELYCNFKPAIPIDELEERILKDFDKNPKQELKTMMKDYLPNALGEFLINSSNLDLRLRLADINREKRKELIRLLTNFKFNFKRIEDIKYAIITKGGINPDEIDPGTMESKLVENLYFCGEVLDVSGLTGGFNLQIAFSTGYAAGYNVFNE